MEEDAPDGEVAKRTLASDDIAGYCSLDLPAPSCDAGECVCEQPPIFPSQRSVTTCGCRTLGTRTPNDGDGTRDGTRNGTHTGAWLMVVAALAFAVRGARGTRGTRAKARPRGRDHDGQARS
jgi:hypothetical protein